MVDRMGGAGMISADGILDAAERCFAQAGVRKTTVEDVAARAGVSRITVYRQLGNRDDLVRAVLLRVTDRFLRRARTKLLTAPDLATAVADLIVSTVVAARRDNSLLLLYGSEETGASGRPLPGTTEPLIERFGAVIEELAAALPGALRDDVSVADAGEWVLRIVVSLLTLEPTTRSGDTDLRRFIETFAVAPLVHAGR